MLGQSLLNASYEFKDLYSFVYVGDAQHLQNLSKVVKIIHLDAFKSNKDKTYFIILESSKPYQNIALYHSKLLISLPRIKIYTQPI